MMDGWMGCLAVCAALHECDRHQHSKPEDACLSQMPHEATIERSNAAVLIHCTLYRRIVIALTVGNASENLDGANPIVKILPPSTPLHLKAAVSQIMKFKM